MRVHPLMVSALQEQRTSRTHRRVPLVRDDVQRKHRMRRAKRD